MSLMLGCYISERISRPKSLCSPRTGTGARVVRHMDLVWCAIMAKLVDCRKVLIMGW